MSLPGQAALRDGSRPVTVGMLADNSRTVHWPLQPSAPLFFLACLPMMRTDAAVSWRGAQAVSHGEHASVVVGRRGDKRTWGDEVSASVTVTLATDLVHVMRRQASGRGPGEEQKLRLRVEDIRLCCDELIYMSCLHRGRVGPR